MEKMSNKNFNVLRLEKTNEHIVNCPHCNETMLIVADDKEGNHFFVYPNKLDKTEKWDFLTIDGDYLNVPGINEKHEEFSFDFGTCNYCNSNIEFLNLHISDKPHEDEFHNDGSLTANKGELYTLSIDGNKKGYVLIYKNVDYRNVFSNELINGNYLAVFIDPILRKEHQQFSITKDILFDNISILKNELKNIK